MAVDLTEKQSSAATKVVGADANGNETTYQKVTSNQDAAVADIVDNGGVHGQISVAANTATAVRVGASNLANRKRLIFTPITGTIAYWGFSNTVTNANGFPVYKNQPVSDDWGPNTTIYIYCTTAITVAVAEGA